MSSRRSFLSGLLSSRARLRFTGSDILPTHHRPAPVLQVGAGLHAVCYQRSTSGIIATNQGSICLLEMPDRCLKDWVHLSLRRAEVWVDF